MDIGRVVLYLRAATNNKPSCIGFKNMVYPQGCGLTMEVRILVLLSIWSLTVGLDVIVS